MLGPQEGPGVQTGQETGQERGMGVGASRRVSERPWPVRAGILARQRSSARRGPGLLAMGSLRRPTAETVEVEVSVTGSGGAGVSVIPGPSLTSPCSDIVPISRGALLLELQSPISEHRHCWAGFWKDTTSQGHDPFMSLASYGSPGSDVRLGPLHPAHRCSWAFPRVPIFFLLGFWLVPHPVRCSEEQNVSSPHLPDP